MTVYSTNSTNCRLFNPVHVVLVFAQSPLFIRRRSWHPIRIFLAPIRPETCSKHFKNYSLVHWRSEHTIGYSSSSSTCNMHWNGCNSSRSESVLDLLESDARMLIANTSTLCFWAIVWTMENLVAPLNRAHRIILGTGMKRFQQISRRISVGIPRIGC